jgi:hypothetical protein
VDVRPLRARRDGGRLLRVAAKGPGGAVTAHLGSRQVSRVIYGAIVGLALVVALEDHPPSAAAVAAILISTAVAVALAELYSELLGTRVRLRHGVDRDRRRAILEEAAAVAAGAAFPALFFLVAAAGAIKLTTAFSIAKWSGLGLIGFYGLCAARLSGAELVRASLEALAVVALGGLVILVKALVH